MNKELMMQFDINKEKVQLEIKREFAASTDLVWKAYTTSELLDQWWAPKPYKTETKSMDFRPGGLWLYCMVSPEDQRHWCRNDYLNIDDQKSFRSRDAFCKDDGGEINTDFPQAEWEITFHAQGDHTVVEIVTSYEKLKDMETVLEMGMKEGFTMALKNLDELLAAQ